MAGLHAPLSTLRRIPHGMLRMTRGRRGSLHLHRNGLAPSTPCRSPGALRRIPFIEVTPNTRRAERIGSSFGLESKTSSTDGVLQLALENILRWKNGQVLRNVYADCV